MLSIPTASGCTEAMIRNGYKGQPKGVKRDLIQPSNMRGRSSSTINCSKQSCQIRKPSSVSDLTHTRQQQWACEIVVCKLTWATCFKQNLYIAHYCIVASRFQTFPMPFVQGYLFDPAQDAKPPAVAAKVPAPPPAVPVEFLGHSSSGDILPLKTCAEAGRVGCSIPSFALFQWRCSFFESFPGSSESAGTLNPVKP